MNDPRRYFHWKWNTEIVLPEAGQASRAILYAVNALQRDMEKVFVKDESNINEAPSAIHIAFDHALTDIPPEGYIIHFDETDTMVVSAGDELGIVFALYFLSETFLGVMPFWYWNDLEPQRRKRADVPLQIYTSPEYRVRYRGWFVNDEVLISGWQPRQEDEAFKWQMVFEALMRLKGNLCIPGTDQMAKQNRKIAEDMGLWITHHHAEPLGAEMFLRAFPMEEPSFGVNPHLFEKLWADAIAQQKNTKTVWSIGFRGQGDRPFWEDDPRYQTKEEIGSLISLIMKQQTEMIRAEVPNAVLCTNLYGEILVLYQQGLVQVPEGVIKIWADNGYGRMVSRRQGNDNPRIPSIPHAGEQGPHGVYYHCSFHDLQASNHLTPSPNSCQFLASQLEQAFISGADELLVVNCGSVKPHVLSLGLMGRMWQAGKMDGESYIQEYARTYYGKGHALVAECLHMYPEKTVRYGKHIDEHAGEQLYHHPVREALCAMVQGKVEEPLPSIVWLAGNQSFPNQIAFFQSLIKKGEAGLERLHAKTLSCEDALQKEHRVRFCDTVGLPVQLHYWGAKGAIAFCESAKYYIRREWLPAFLWAAQALRMYQHSVQEMERAGHDRWEGFYQNDCLTNIRLTRDMMRTYVGHIRIMGDGPSFHGWEKTWLMPKEDQGIELLSTSTIHWSDEELARKIAEADYPDLQVFCEVKDEM